MTTDSTDKLPQIAKRNRATVWNKKSCIITFQAGALNLCHLRLWLCIADTGFDERSLQRRRQLPLRNFQPFLSRVRDCTPNRSGQSLPKYNTSCVEILKKIATLLRSFYSQRMRKCRNDMPGVPGEFCTGVNETNWYERSLLWHEESDIRRSRS